MEIEVTEQDGMYRAVDGETGTSVTAPSKESALIALALSLRTVQVFEQSVRATSEGWKETSLIIRQIQGELEGAIRTISDEMVQSLNSPIAQLPGRSIEEGDSIDPVEEMYSKLSQNTKKRFDEEDITEGDIDDAIQWARTQ